MTEAEIEWVNNYHRTVYDRLAPSLTPDEREWLADACKPLS